MSKANRLREYSRLVAAKRQADICPSLMAEFAPENKVSDQALHDPKSGKSSDDKKKKNAQKEAK